MAQCGRIPGMAQLDENRNLRLRASTLSLLLWGPHLTVTSYLSDT